MKSMQSLVRVLQHNQKHSLFLQNSYLRFSTTNETDTKDFSVSRLLEDESMEMRKKVVKEFLEFQEANKKTMAQLEEKSLQVAGLDKIISEQNKKLKDLRTNLQFQIEDVELTRNRLEKEKELSKIYAITAFAKELLDVQDNLERAIHANQAKYEGKNDSLFDGVTMTNRILDKLLQRNGVVEIDCLNKKFDPNQAEALVQVDDPSKEPKTVAFIAQKGYMIKDRVLRAAKVGIVRDRD